MNKNEPFWTPHPGSAKKSPFGGYKAGVFGNIIAEESLAEEGLAEEGLAEEGLPEEGLAEEGLAEEGLAEEGLAEEGLAKIFRPGLDHT